MRIKAEFPISSPEFIRWSNKTTQYNTTSLAQAVSLYAAEHSVGDVGGEDADYVPKAGYIGTLAPGENFEESHPMNKLPNKVLHPWPAMQEIPFHVRWPPSHPMTPPPQLWFALNNMYTEVSWCESFFSSSLRTSDQFVDFILFYTNILNIYHIYYILFCIIRSLLHQSLLDHDTQR